MDPFAQASLDMAETDLGVTVSYTAPGGGDPYPGLRLIVGAVQGDVLDRGVGARSSTVVGTLPLAGLGVTPVAKGKLTAGPGPWSGASWRIEEVEVDMEQASCTLTLTPLGGREGR